MKISASDLFPNRKRLLFSSATLLFCILPAAALDAVVPREPAVIAPHADVAAQAHNQTAPAEKSDAITRGTRRSFLRYHYRFNPYRGYHRPYFYGPYWAYPYYYGPHRAYWNYKRHFGSVDLNIKPRRAKVYLNGSYIGKAAKYDGFPSHLVLREGTYELIFYLDGHQTVRREVTVTSGQIVRENINLENGNPTPPDQLTKMSKAPLKHEQSGEPGFQRRYRVKPKKVPAKAAQDQHGLLKMTIEPLDASVYLDGKFLGIAGDINRRLSGIPLEPGKHLLELVRPGHRQKQVPFEISTHETTNLTVDLSPGK